MALFGRDKQIEQLENVPIFQGCTRRQLLEVVRISEVVEVPAGKPLARAGEPGHEFYLILEGTARVEVTARRSRRLGPGDFFGEMSLLDGEPRSATVVAETPMRLLMIHRRVFWTLLSEIPHLTYKILVTLSQRIRQLEKSQLA